MTSRRSSKFILGAVPNNRLLGIATREVVLSGLVNSSVRIPWLPNCPCGFALLRLPLCLRGCTVETTCLEAEISRRIRTAAKLRRRGSTDPEHLCALRGARAGNRRHDTQAGFTNSVSRDFQRRSTQLRPCLIHYVQVTEFRARPNDPPSSTVQSVESPLYASVRQDSSDDHPILRRMRRWRSTQASTARPLSRGKLTGKLDKTLTQGKSPLMLDACFGKRVIEGT